VPGRPAAWAATALAAFTVWSFLSLAWAEARGDAWDGANRTLLYLTVFALFALIPWRPTEAALFLAAFAIATAVAGMWSVADALTGSERGVFVDGRLAGPVGYENASAALFLAAFWPAVMLATRPGLPGLARGVLLAASGVLLELLVLCQSRGSLLAAGAALILALAVTRERRRLLLVLAAVSGVALLTLPFLLDVYGSAGSSGDDALLHAAVAITVSAAALMAAGVAGSRLAVRPRGAVAFALMGALAVSGLGVAVAGATAAGASSTRFAGGAESGRYDFWRVAWRQFARHPVHGAGADNFARDYAREGRRHEEPLYPHSVVLRTLGQTGLVGTVLLAAFLLAACAATRPWKADAVTAAALASALAWLAHASIDWLWELPALGGPAMACLGLVAARGGPPQASSPRKTRRFAVAMTVAAIAAAASCALPALAAWEIERAVPAWEDDPATARHRLERARGLNPLSDRPDAIAGTLALEDGDIAGARDAFRRAAARDPGNWYVQMQLAVVDLRQARRTTAIAGLTRARRLNPREPSIGIALAAAQRGERVPAEVEAYVSGLAVPGPRGRHPVHCRPVLGLGTACGETPPA
jgi:hypothetical protein